MNLYNIIGACIIAAPFVALFAYVVKQDGWLVAVALFVTIAAITGFIFLGVVFLNYKSS